MPAAHCNSVSPVVCEALRRGAAFPHRHREANTLLLTEFVVTELQSYGAPPENMVIRAREWPE